VRRFYENYIDEYSRFRGEEVAPELLQEKGEFLRQFRHSRELYKSADGGLGLAGRVGMKLGKYVGTAERDLANMPRSTKIAGALALSAAGTAAAHKAYKALKKRLKKRKNGNTDVHPETEKKNGNGSTEKSNGG